MQARVDKGVIRNIIGDITRGVFSQPDAITTEYYANDSVEVRVGVDWDCNLIEFSVTITDNNGNEYPLTCEQYDYLCSEMKQELYEYTKELRSEAEYRRTAYA